MNKINTRNKFNVKNSSDCYLTINGKEFIQWTDEAGSNKELANKIKDDLINKGYKSIIKLINKQFYRVYKENIKITEPTEPTLNKYYENLLLKLKEGIKQNGSKTIY